MLLKENPWMQCTDRYTDQQQLVFSSSFHSSLPPVLTSRRQETSPSHTPPPTFSHLSLIEQAHFGFK
ncbi:hypothetical protein DAI22_05g170100 [Oryza sativa Japonica Group]|nr:hypothetical protein DAI22_05g170100 [Oryza sativa Japonica Group]